MITTNSGDNGQGKTPQPVPPTEVKAKTQRCATGGVLVRRRR